MVVQSIGRQFTKVFGSRNQRVIRSYNKRVEQINTLDAGMRALTDAQLRAKTAEFRERSKSGEPLSARLLEIMAVAREAMDRAVGIRCVFDPQHGFDPAVLSPEAQQQYAELKAQADALEPVAVAGGQPAPGWLQIDIPPAFYEAVRAVHSESKPPFRARPFDVQLIGGMVLGEGKIAEMRTGEGKTIVAPLACYVACCDGLQCHVVTVNDYLVQRDRDWVFPFYYYLGLTVGAIHPQHMQPPHLKAEAYRCDVLYATNAELGFDFLRDNMKMSAEEQVQKHRDFCIIDEVDSILIDEARTPLIISGPAHNETPRYDLADQIALHLMKQQAAWNAADKKVVAAEMKIKGLEGDARNARDKAVGKQHRETMQQLIAELPALEQARDQHVQYYEVEMDKKAAHLTHEGTAEAQKVAGVGSFYVGDNMDLPHLIGNAVRAHAVYQRDQQYMVQGGEVIIIDENTGRPMIGRQWSDGLHQAVEAKEKVQIKQETQTLATVTIQNFFKLYKRLAGMTGTAITEATEFNEIYKLDVVSVPTNKPIQRIDRDDLIYLSTKDKWNAIVDEIKRVHDTGRPTLVGTTSVDKSEMLSAMLKKKHGIKHSVLNAKAENAENESGVVEDAGELGAVMIATNMAGRGTDIKLRAVGRGALIDHWKARNLLPHAAGEELDDDALIALSYRHQAAAVLGIPKKEAQDTSDDDLKLRLFRYWAEHDGWAEPKKAAKMTLEECVAVLDGLPDYPKHKLAVWPNVEAMGGLHIIGTERHESRRIDNQLRGRAGRQGDRGSSRFFLSLEDDLMQMFAGGITMTMLSKLGMKEGDAIEHSMVSKSVGRAQRKVEERNYEIRKNLLEYDEVMEHQRSDFYGLRQDVLEGKDVHGMVLDYIDASVQDATDKYLAPDYVKQRAAEWCQSELGISIDPARLQLEDLGELEEYVRKSARSEVASVVDVTLGEYMGNDMLPEDWDLKGLSDWARTEFGVALSVADLQQSNPHDVQTSLTASAQTQVDGKDLSGLAQFLEENIPQNELIAWAKNKFGLDVAVEELHEKGAEAANTLVTEKAHAAYNLRALTYPIEFTMEVLSQGAQQDPDWTMQQLQGFAKQRYNQDWDAEELQELDGQAVFQKLLNEQAAWMKQDGKLEEEAAAIYAELGSDPEKLAAKLKERYGSKVTAEQIAADDDPKQLVVDEGLALLRTELGQLERYVLLQILDATWKDHLYAMDQLKESVGLRGYAEKDPRIEYKREGANQYVNMQGVIQDRVTDLIFRARLTPNVRLQSPDPAQMQAAQPAAPSAAVAHQAGPDPAAAAAAQQAAAGAEQANLEDAAPDAPVPRSLRRKGGGGEDPASGGGNKSQYKSRKKRK